MYYGGIETGGTKIVCGVGTETGEILERTSFQTTKPSENIAQIHSFFNNKPIKAIGIGSFGPIDIDKNSSTYGYIKGTPKRHWQNFDLVGAVSKYFSFPIGFNTDVNAAALGEMTWGAAKGHDNCLYMTIGTGIGVGAISNGEVLQGMTHPEMGHIMIKRHPNDTFAGTCQYHHDCLEGLAAGPAIEQRWGKKGIDLQDNIKVWKMESFYLAQAITNFILILTPKKVILGGGVMKQRHLFQLIREQVSKNLNGYINTSELANLESYIVPALLEDNAGLSGCIALAKKAGK